MYQNQINTLLLYMSRTVTFLRASNQRRRGLNPTPKLLFRVRMPSRIQAKTHARAASGQTDRKTQGEKNTQGGPDRYAELAGVETRRLPVVRVGPPVEHGDVSRLRQHQWQSLTLCFGSGPPLHGGADAGLFLSPSCLLSFEDQKDCDSNKSSKAPTKQQSFGRKNYM